MKKRPLVLSIAGFDPTGGAGILADIKTFEQNRVQGMSIITGNTVQTESKFLQVDWVNEAFIFEQLEALINQYQFDYIKVGLIPNLAFFFRLLNHPKLKQTKFIWDPILSTSSGFDFEHNLEELNQVLSKVYLITPNWHEIKALSGNSNSKLGAIELAKLTNVYLKGGHADEEIGKDFMYANNGKVYPFNNRARYASEKHGSGCIFSSALTAQLALELPMIKACLKSKKYITEVLESNKGLLGYHKR
jgi:hydroxymethylpyrimidine/phosphomethylpyrimidine kinase